jgi:MFS family permease
MQQTLKEREKTGFGAVLQRPAFTVLFASEAISLIGDRLVMVALVILVYNLTESSAAVSALMMFKAGPALILGIAAGALVDRFNRKWVMVLSNLAQGLLVLIIPFSDSLKVIYGVYLLMSMINQFFIPARSATIPDLVPKELLLSANSLFSIAYVGAVALGPAIGGFLIDQYGLDMAFYVDSLTFLIPAFAVSLLALPERQKPTSKSSIMADLRVGFAYIQSKRAVKAGLFLSMAVYLGLGTFSVLGIVLAEEILQVGAGGYGMLMSSMGVGLLVGAALMGRWGARFSHTRLSAIGTILASIMLVLLPWSTSLTMALIIAAGNGFGMVMVQTSANTTFQLAPEALRGRIIGVSQALIGASSFLAMGLSGLLAEWIGVQAVFGIVGLIAIATTLILRVVLKERIS